MSGPSESQGLNADSRPNGQQLVSVTPSAPPTSGGYGYGGMYPALHPETTRFVAKLFEFWWILKKRDRKSTRLNSSHANISYAVFCLKKKKKNVYETVV